MRHFRTILATIAAATLSVTLSAQSLRTTNAQLQAENEALKSHVDSLTNLLKELKDKSQQDDKTIRELQDAHRKATERHEYEAFSLGPDAKDTISLWDTQDRLSKVKEVQYDMDSVKLSSKVSDDIYLERLKDMNNIFALPYNDIVRNYVVLYAEKRSSSTPALLGLCSYYFPIIQEAFNKYGIPEELAALSIVESALNPTATSRVGARGMWQFMYATAKSYGLRINSYVDERLDVYKAVDAAARFLRDAYNRYGDWSLAISSYNCGSGNIKRAIARNGGNTDYWGIYQYLPKETRGYVPAFVGALYLTKYYKEHGYNPKPCSLPEKVDTFVIHRKLHFTQLNKVIGVPIDDLRHLNPQYIHDIIPGSDHDYILRIPEQYADAFMENADSVYRYKADSLFNPLVIKQIETGTAPTSGSNRISYKVKNGDTLSKIAAQYKVNINDIKRWNNLKSTNIRVGQTIYIFKGGAPKPTTVSQPTPKPAEPAKTAQPAEPAKPAAPARTEEKIDSLTNVIDSTVTAVEDSLEAEEEIREITQHPGLAAAQAAQTAPAEQKTELKDDPVIEKKDDYIEYTVKKGDTLFAISKKFNGVSAKAIMDLNKISADIHPGDVLKIPVIN